MALVDPYFDYYREKSQIDIVDFSYFDLSFKDLYDKDSRIEKYHNAYIIPYPELKNWSMAGRFITFNNILGGTKSNCGQIRGIKKSKFEVGKPKPLINNCGRLHCKICFREALSLIHI